MKRLDPGLVVRRKRDRVNQSVNFRVLGRDLIAHRIDLVFKLNIANVNFATRHQTLERFQTLWASHDVDNFRAPFFERFANMPRHALFISHAKHDDGFATEF